MVASVCVNGPFKHIVRGACPPRRYLSSTLPLISLWQVRVDTPFRLSPRAENDLVRDVVSALGFESAVSCHPGLGRLGDDPMALPRIDVYGGCTPEDLIAQVS